MVKLDFAKDEHRIMVAAALLQSGYAVYFPEILYASKKNAGEVCLIAGKPGEILMRLDHWEAQNDQKAH
jgi:hypothetical protein